MSISQPSAPASVAPANTGPANTAPINAALFNTAAALHVEGAQQLGLASGADCVCEAASEQAAISLDRLPLHTSARVVDLCSAGNPADEALLLRLMEIGFLPGEHVRIVATGFPGPDPLAVRVGAATFALRRGEASKVLVALEAQP